MSCSQNAKYDKAKKQITSWGAEIVDSNNYEGWYIFLKGDAIYFWDITSRNEPHYIYSPSDEKMEMFYSIADFDEEDKTYELTKLSNVEDYEYDSDFGPFDMDTFYHSVEILRKVDGSILGFTFYEPEELVVFYVPFDKNNVILHVDGFRLNSQCYAIDNIWLGYCFPDVARRIPGCENMEIDSFFCIPVGFENGTISQSGPTRMAILDSIFDYDPKKHSQYSSEVYKRVYEKIISDVACYELDFQSFAMKNAINARSLIGEYRYILTTFTDSVDYTDYVRFSRREYGFQYCLHNRHMSVGEVGVPDFETYYYTNDTDFLSFKYPAEKVLVLAQLADLNDEEAHFINTIYIPSSYK